MCVCGWGVFFVLFSPSLLRGFYPLFLLFFFLFLHVRLWLKGKVPRLQLAAPPRPALIYPSKVHTHRHTHTPSSSLVTDLCQPCALSWCSASAHVLQFPHIQTLYVFLIIFPPPFRDTVTIFNRKDNCWFNYIYRMLNLKPHPTSLHRYSQASDKANSTLTFFSVANFAKCYLQILCGEEHQRQKMKRMKDEMKEAVPALNLHTQLTSLKPN